MVACDDGHRNGEWLTWQVFLDASVMRERLCSESEGLFFEGREPQLRFIRRVTLTVLVQDSTVGLPYGILVYYS